jgi:hypothetical protein
MGEGAAEMYGKDVQAEAHKAADDFRIGVENGDITKAIQDIADLSGLSLGAALRP